MTALARQFFAGGAGQTPVPPNFGITKLSQSERMRFSVNALGDSCSRRQPASSDDALHHMSVNIGKPEITARVTVGELLVIETQQMQNCRVEVVHVNDILDGFETE